jgi:peptide/nickel transport system permease protein
MAEAGVTLIARTPNGLRRAGEFFRRWPVVSVALLAVFALMAILAPLIAPHPPRYSDLRERNLPPVWYPEGRWEYPLGKDPLGRDVLSRVIYGARVSLSVVTVAVIIGTVVGTTLGMVAGYAGGAIDEVIMRLVDVWYGIPFIMIALIIALTIGASVYILVGVLALGAFGSFVRQIRAEVLTLKERDYVALAKVAGASTPRIIFRHILPGIFNTMIVIATLSTGGLILAESFLSFLGAGIPPPTPTWGAMIADGRQYLRDAWWVTVMPGIAIMITVVAINFLGDWLRDTFDPRLRQV